MEAYKGSNGGGTGARVQRVSQQPNSGEQSADLERQCWCQDCVQGLSRILFLFLQAHERLQELAWQIVRDASMHVAAEEEVLVPAVQQQMGKEIMAP